MKIKTKSKKVNKAWLHDHLNDPYVKLAQREGYRARAAYKLKEIDEELHLLEPGQLVVDLGAAPGAWSQYVRRKFAPQAPAPAAPRPAPLQRHHHRARPARVRADRRRRLHPGRLPRGRGPGRSSRRALAGRPVDVVLSDMAPNLSGIAAADAARMADLVELAVEFARGHLRAGGRAGLQGLSRQRLQPAGRAVQGRRFGSSSRSSRRPRATSRPKPSWSASV